MRIRSSQRGLDRSFEYLSPNTHMRQFWNSTARGQFLKASVLLFEKMHRMLFDLSTIRTLASAGALLLAVAQKSVSDGMGASQREQLVRRSPRFKL